MIVERLQVQTELRVVRSEEPGKPERDVGADAALAEHDLVDAVRRDPDPFSKTVLVQSWLRGKEAVEEAPETRVRPSDIRVPAGRSTRSGKADAIGRARAAHDATPQEMLDRLRAALVPPWLRSKPSQEAARGTEARPPATAPTQPVPTSPQRPHRVRRTDR